MPSRVSFFNPAVYRKNLTRFAPLWLAYLALWLILLPLNILSDRDYSWLDVWSIRYMVMDSSFEYTIIISLIYAILVAMALHGWYYRNASVNALAALPIRRETWFCTNLITALTMGLIPNLIVALAIWASAASIGVAGGVAAMCWLAINSLVYLFFYALAALCAAVVGQILALPALYILVNFTAVVINYVTVTILSCFVYGMNAHHYTTLAPLSPAYYLITRISAQYEYSELTGETVNLRFLHWGYLLGLTVAAVILLAIAFLLFRRRRMEAAGDMIAVRPLRPVFKYCFATGCALVLGTLAAFLTARHGIESSMPLKLLCWLLAGGFVGYFTAEILLKKTFRVFGREWLGFGVFALCLIAAVLLMEFDVTGFERRIPDLEDVESVHIQAFYRSGGDFTVEDPAVIADFMSLHRAIIQDKKNQDILSRPEYNDEASSTVFYLDYNLRSGKVMERQYSIYCTPEQWNSPDSPGRLMCELLSRPDNLLLSVLPEFPIEGPENILSAHLDNSAEGVIKETGGKYGDQTVTDAEKDLNLSQEEAWRLFSTCILPDLREGKIGMPDFYYFQDRPYYHACIEFSFVNDPYAKDSQIHSWINLNLTIGSRTAQYFIDRGCTLLTDEEVGEMYDLYYEREQ